MSRKIAIIVAALAVIVIVVLIVLLSTKQQQAAPSVGGGSGNTTGANATSTQVSPTRETVSTNVAVPEKGATNLPANVAAPQVQAQANPSSNASYRSFSVTVNGSSFTPNTIIVNQGDDADIEITAAGGNYDFTQPDYGFHVQLPEGKTTKIDFSATASGKFTFYCSSCGGPDKGPTGYVEVVPAK